MKFRRLPIPVCYLSIKENIPNLHVTMAKRRRNLGGAALCSLLTRKAQIELKKGQEPDEETVRGRDVIHKVG